MKREKPPEHLTSESKKLWRTIVADYEIDAPAEMVLVATLEARDRRDQARAELAKSGVTVEDRFGQLKASPWVAIERDSATTMMRGFRLLGFDQEQRGVIR